MRRMIIALAVGTLVIASSLCLRAQDAATSVPAPADGEKIKSLVKALGSDDFKVREQAQKDLTAIGIPAKADVAEAMKSEDMEVKQRAEQIMATIVKAEQLAKNDLVKKNYLWGFTIDKGMSQRPVIAGNVALAAGLDGKIYAVDLKTGKQVWMTTDVPVAKLKPGEDPTSKPATAPATISADAVNDEEAQAKKEAEEKEKEARLAQANAAGMMIRVNGQAISSSDMQKALSAPVVSGDMFVYCDGTQINCATLKGGKLAWSLLANGQPTIADGLVFVGGNNGGIDAIDVKTGKLVWRAKDALATFSRPAAGDGFVCIAGMENANAAGAAPAVAPAVRVAPIRAIGNLAGTHIQSLDSKTGKELWKVPAANCQAVYVAGGLVIWQAHNTLTALDAKDGRQVWMRELPVTDSTGAVRNVVMRSLPGLTDSDDLLISGEGIYLISGGEAVALDVKTGKDIWRTKLDLTDTEAAASETDAAVAPNGRMVNRRIVVQGGQRVQMAVVMGGQTVTIGGTGAPVVDGNTVYVATTNGIHAFDIKTGQRLWHFRTASAPNGKLVIVDGVLYYGSVPQQPARSGGPDVVGLNALKAK